VTPQQAFETGFIKRAEELVKTGGLDNIFEPAAAAEVKTVDEYYKLKKLKHTGSGVTNKHVTPGFVCDTTHGGFRGQDYHHVVQGVSGLSLYGTKEHPVIGTYLPNKQVRHIADKLKNMGVKSLEKYEDSGVSRKEIGHLAKMFKHYASQGAILRADY
jgi:hypothetical protein